MGHVLTENRNGLVVDVRITQATGTAERDAAAEMQGEASLEAGYGELAASIDVLYSVPENVRIPIILAMRISIAKFTGPARRNWSQ
jgi:hypothetical protein